MMQSLRMMQKTFLKTDEAQEIILLDYWGYPLAPTQRELTYAQRMFIIKGRAKFEKELREAEEKEMKKHRRKMRYQRHITNALNLVMCLFFLFKLIYREVAKTYGFT